MKKQRFTRVAALVAGLLVPVVVGATTFVAMDDETLFRTSTAVVIGTVTAIESGQATPDSAIYTYVHVQPIRVLKGELGNEPLVLREPGGTANGVTQWTFGAPEFWVGERSLLFLSRNADGTLQTNSLAMGKFTIGVDTAGNLTAVRDYGYGATVLVPDATQGQQLRADSRSLQPFVQELRRMQRGNGRRPHRPLQLTPPELSTTTTEYHEAFTFLTTPPGRWFQPDSGQAVSYLVDSTGDATLGFATSRAAVDAALAAWTNVPTASLILQDGGTTTPAPFGPCDANRIVFNDPYNEVTDPSGCSGVLAIGGYCSSSNSTVVNGTTFNQIVVGKVTVNNGWGGCAVWTQCNLSEVLTHEIGHTIGLGHSADSTATMAATAHFDGRCATVETDDINGVTFIYPQSGPTPTPTPAPVLHLDPIASPIVVGGTTTLTGSDFTAGSVIKLFVATASGTMSFGPYTPVSHTSSALTWQVSASISLGNGFGTVVVINTDQGYVQSNLQSQLLYGSSANNLPTIFAINNVNLRALDATIPVANVETVVTQGSVVTLSGSGFNNSLVNLFTAAGNFGPLTPLAGATTTQLQVMVPANTPTGPGSFQVVNSPYTGNVMSNAVSVPIGAQITVSSVTQNGSTITVNGTGFSALTVINFFNGGANRGGFNGAGSPQIPLTIVSPAQFTFTVPAGAVSGSAYVMALNPPFIPFSSSGTGPGGGFTLSVP